MIYKALLVDDEKLVRDVLPTRIAWAELGIELVATATNGREALRLIESDDIRIVLTDIKMPEMDGLELIRRASSADPGLVFIVLSGHSDFDFARLAMRYGVRHYLLKPTDPLELSRLLGQVREEIDEAEKRERFLRTSRELVEKYRPLAREQFLRDLMTSTLYVRHEITQTAALLGFEPTDCRLMAFQLAGDAETTDLISLKRVVERGLAKLDLVLTTMIKDFIVAALPAVDGELAMEAVRAIKKRFAQYSQVSVAAAISGVHAFEHMHQAFDEVCALLSFRYYGGPDIIITPEDIGRTPRSFDPLEMEGLCARVAAFVACGDLASTQAGIRQLFDLMEEERLAQEQVLKVVIQLLLDISRAEDSHDAPSAISAILPAVQAADLHAVRKLLMQTCSARCEENYCRHTRRSSRLVEQVKVHIREHLSNTELNLKWLAENLVYANPDYLSKLFKRETGENFNHYLMTRRTEEAVRLMQTHPDIPISEIAAKTGFGHNSQYFSQVFKRVTGLTPSEYRGTARSPIDQG